MEWLEAAGKVGSIVAGVCGVFLVIMRWIDGRKAK